MVSNPAQAANGRAAAWRPVTEGEGFDRDSLSLPGRQMDLVKALATRNPQARRARAHTCACTSPPLRCCLASSSPC